MRWAVVGIGLRPGDHVALMVGDHVEAVEAYLGCLLGGYPAIHISDRLAGAEVTPILADADARTFVYTAGVTGKVAALDAVSEVDFVVAIGEREIASH
jgi:acyl-CoA synthetase (AMP-forming)/AMP-acid ligase II